MAIAAHKSLAIYVNNFKFIHRAATYTNESNEDDRLFVGRKNIKDKLVGLLRKSTRGSYLLAGYRGVGKTSVLNKAIFEYNKYKIKNIKKDTRNNFKNILPKLFHKLYFSEPKRAIVVNVNLGENSRLKPHHIFYSITNILLTEFGEYFCVRHKVTTSIISIGLMTSFVLLLLPILHHTRLVDTVYPFFLAHSDSQDYGVFIGLNLYIIPIFAFIVFLFLYLKGEYYRREILHELGDLATRMEFEITEGKNVGVQQSGFHFGLTRSTKSLPLQAREVEFKLMEILKNHRKRSFTNTDIIFVFDEIDKLSEKDIYDDDRRNSDKTDNTITNKKMDRIDDLLASIKYFITTAEAQFFFVSGRETLERYYSERGSANSLYESLFDQVIEIPSLLTDKSHISKDNPSSKSPITKLIEEYVCQRLGNRTGPENLQDVPYSSLNEFYTDLVDQISKDTSIADKNPSYHEARLAILVLRNFINYLTFHTWGNPKRLASFLEGFLISDQQLDSPKTIFINNQDDSVDGKLCLYFDFNSQRSLALASNIFTLFQHELSREVSQAGDKITISALSSLQFILKLHHYGFTRESLHRMSEAINIYRSPELDNLVDDLLSHVFKPYIRRIRNGAYRYRFNSGFEQELRYITHVSDLESASYNFSIDAMHRVKQYFENDLEISRESGLTLVAAKAHITLGDMNAIEQSYNTASRHYTSAITILSSQVGISDSTIPDKCPDLEIAMLYVESMIKHGDLEEHRQNYNKAAAIYAQVNNFICRILLQYVDENLQPLKQGDSKWDIFKQAYWASRFLSLKRSPQPTDNTDSSNSDSSELTEDIIDINKSDISRLTGLFSSEEDPRFFFRRANLFFYHGLPDLEKAITNYSKCIMYSKRMPFSSENDSVVSERRDYLIASSLVGLAETKLVRKAVDLLNEPQNFKKDLKTFVLELTTEVDISDTFPPDVDSSDFEQIREHYNDNSNILVLLQKAAKLYSNNGLYVGAVVTHIKIIAYCLRMLDYFNRDKKEDSNGDKNEDFEESELKLIFQIIDRSTIEAIKYIDQARQLESSQFTKTLVIRDYDLSEDAADCNGIFRYDLLPRLLELFHPDNQQTTKEYPVDDGAFWQHSIWGQKLVSILYWGELVRSKLYPRIDGWLVGDGFEPSKMPTLSIRSSILMRWVYARRMYKLKFDKKLHVLDSTKKDGSLGPLGKNFLDDAIKVDSLSETTLWWDAYKISRNLYFALLDIRLISRKNLDLVFPTITHVYYVQWKLLACIIQTIVIQLQNDKNYFGKKLESMSDIGFFIQKVFRAIDEKIGGVEGIAPSHYDYEYVTNKFKVHLRESINLIDQTSRIRTNILQQKYFAHDDHSDPEFRMDWTLSNMFCPAARHMLDNVEKKHKELVQKINDL